ncbi:MAG: DUF3226 domain-containing protein [Chloroflexota bacterium]|nr:DUF3226 domain-containing protein [Chloroflexota bacterium]
MDAPRPLKSIAEPKVLIVEGEDDRRLFSELIAHLHLSEIEVRAIGGKTKFRSNVKALTITSGFDKVSSVGVIRDADEDPTAAFQSVCDALQDTGLPRPEEPLQPVGDSPQVLVMLLPDGETPGMLEDLCLQSVKEDPATRCVDEYFECLQDQLNVLPRNLSKARLHAFLASRERPDLRLGEAAQRGYWLWDHPVFEQSKRFLRML